MCLYNHCARVSNNNMEVDMNRTKEIRDEIVKGLVNSLDFSGEVIKELNGFHFSAVDYALKTGEKESLVYRIAIVPHKHKLELE